MHNLAQPLAVPAAAAAADLIDDSKSSYQLVLGVDDSIQKPHWRQRLRMPRSLLAMLAVQCLTLRDAGARKAYQSHSSSSALQQLPAQQGLQAMFAGGPAGVPDFQSAARVWPIFIARSLLLECSALCGRCMAVTPKPWRPCETPCVHSLDAGKVLRSVALFHPSQPICIKSTAHQLCNCR